MKSLFKRLLKVALFLVFFMFIISCGREKPTLAKIKVIDTNNQIVSNARVILCPCPDPVLSQVIPNDTLTTDSDGLATFNYTDEHNLGTAGFRVLDIWVNAGDTLFGYGIIKVVEQEVNEATVVVSVPWFILHRM